MVETIKGKYRIVREIARSNDIVYEATDVTLGRRIAIKELNLVPGLTGQARRDRIERFNREARAAGRLDHPNIVSVFDFGEENGRYFIAMEYLEGQSLRDAMQVRGAYPMREAIEIMGQILDALAYAHSKNVVHRDIKPDNIHVLPGGQIKLTDFGIARLSDESALTADGQIFGTPSYMSPEQIEGRGLDHRSDLFSLGVLLYEMLAGRKPFTGDGVVAITYAIMNAEPPPMIGVPAGIEQVVRNALSKNPNQRPASADQMKRDLRAAEQTPSIFLPRQPTHMGQTNMGQTGMGGGYYGGNQGQASPYPSSSPSVGGYGGGYGAAPSMPGYAPANTPPPAAPAGNLPWGWNGAGNAPAGAGGGQTNYPQTQAVQGGYPSAGYIAQAQAQAAAVARPAEPLFTLSPGMRQIVTAVGIAVLLGGILAGIVVLVQKSFGSYTETAKVQQVATLMTQGEQAYNNQDYVTAAQDYQQALMANPTPAQRTTLDANLAYTYVQLGRAARTNNKLEEARDDFAKALEYQPDYQTAHTELANVKQSLGDTSGAQEERHNAASAPAGPEPPQHLDNRAPIGGSATRTPSDPTPPQDPNQFLNQRRQEATNLIQQGDDLWKRGDKEGARDKWRDAIEKGAGFPEFDTANQRLHDTEPQVNFGGDG